MKMQRVVLLGLLLVALMLVGCSSGEEPAAEGDPYIAVISKGFQHQFWQAVKSGADRKPWSLSAFIRVLPRCHLCN